jgi:CheY-like chemotaxis protein
MSTPTFVHIIDASKPSLVMTSEVFKDKIPNTIVTHSPSAKDAMTYLATKVGQESPDVVVVDFDLPDADGVSLIRELRKMYKGPIFLTAFPSDIVKHAVSEELFHYNDSLQWISKPVRADGISQKIEQFLINRFRLGRRFDVDFLTLCIGKGAGRGKRAPKFDGRTTNLSLGGAGVDFERPTKLKIGEELLLSMAVPPGAIEGSGPLSNLKPLVQMPKPVAAKAKVVAKAPPKKGSTLGKEGASSKIPDMPEPANHHLKTLQKLEEYKIRATVAWLGQGGRKVGLTFGRITDHQRRQIEIFLKGLSL